MIVGFAFGIFFFVIVVLATWLRHWQKDMGDCQGY